MSENFQPTFESLRAHECPKWFQDAKFGIWSHWGPQSVPMCGDWYARNMYIQGSRSIIIMSDITDIRPNSDTRISVNSGKRRTLIRRA